MATASIPHSSNPRNDLSADYVRSILRYNPRTGLFHWRRRTDISAQGERRANKIAGFVHKDGYRRIKINDISYLAHRLAWLHMTGSWPTHEVDHTKSNRSDNRWKKLRAADDFQTARNAKKRKNAKHSLKGIAQQRNGRWMARIRVKRKLLHLGTFDTAKIAHAAYCAAAIKYHGAFARFN